MPLPTRRRPRPRGFQSPGARATLPEIPRPRPIQLFIQNSSPMAFGVRLRTTDTSGNHARRSSRATGVPIPMVAGFTRTPAGRGCRKSHSAGPLIITDAGRGCATSDGFGSLEMNGPLRGYHGARATITSVGRRFLQKRASISATAFTTGPIIITTSAQTNIVSFRQISLERSASSALSFRPNVT